MRAHVHLLYTERTCLFFLQFLRLRPPSHKKWVKNIYLCKNSKGAKEVLLIFSRYIILSYSRGGLGLKECLTI